MRKRYLQMTVALSLVAFLVVHTVKAQDASARAYLREIQKGKRDSAENAKTMMRVIRITAKYPYVASIRSSLVDPQDSQLGLVVKVNSKWSHLSTRQKRQATASLFHLWLSFCVQTNYYSSAMRIEDAKGRAVMPSVQGGWMWESSIPATDKLF